MDDDGGVEEAFCVGAPPAGDDGDARECVSREVVKNSVEYLVRKATSDVARSFRQRERCRRRWREGSKDGIMKAVKHRGETIAWQAGTDRRRQYVGGREEGERRRNALFQEGTTLLGPLTGRHRCSRRFSERRGGFGSRVLRLRLGATTVLSPFWRVLRSNAV